MDGAGKARENHKIYEGLLKGIKREFPPIKDKVGHVSQLGQDLIDSFPAERENIEQRAQDVQEK